MTSSGMRPSARNMTRSADWAPRPAALAAAVAALAVARRIALMTSVISAIFSGDFSAGEVDVGETELPNAGLISRQDYISRLPTQSTV